MTKTTNSIFYVIIAILFISITSCGKDDITESTLPTILTNDISDITSASAIVGANITDDGNATITTKGVCYSTTSNPTIDNSKVTSGSSENVFNCQLANLNPSTTYYVRAFATNEKGTSYGSEKQFSTTAQGTNTFSAILNTSSFNVQSINVSNAGGKLSITAMSGAGSERIIVWMPSDPSAGNYSADEATSSFYVQYMQNTSEVFVSDGGNVNITNVNDLTGKIEGTFDVSASYNDSTITISAGHFSVYK